MAWMDFFSSFLILSHVIYMQCSIKGYAMLSYDVERTVYPTTQVMKSSTAGAFAARANMCQWGPEQGFNVGSCMSFLLGFNVTQDACKLFDMELVQIQRSLALWWVNCGNFSEDFPILAFWIELGEFAGLVVRTSWTTSPDPSAGSVRFDSDSSQGEDSNTTKTISSIFVDKIVSRCCWHCSNIYPKV